MTHELVIEELERQKKIAAIYAQDDAKQAADLLDKAGRAKTRQHERLRGIDAIDAAIAVLKTQPTD